MYATKSWQCRRGVGTRLGLLYGIHYVIHDFNHVAIAMSLLRLQRHGARLLPELQLPSPDGRGPSTGRVSEALMLHSVKRGTQACNSSKLTFKTLASQCWSDVLHCTS